MDKSDPIFAHSEYNNIFIQVVRTRDIKNRACAYSTIQNQFLKVFLSNDFLYVACHEEVPFSNLQDNNVHYIYYEDGQRKK